VSRTEQKTSKTDRETDQRRQEIARRLAAAYISYEVSMTPASVYKTLKTSDMGEAWLRVAELLDAAFHGERTMPAPRKSARAGN